MGRISLKKQVKGLKKYLTDFECGFIMEPGETTQMLSHHDLQNCSFFGGLVEEEIEKLLPLMQEEKFEAGTEIITEGSLNDRICFIMEGMVQVWKGKLLVAEINEGENFGEMEVLDVMPSAATIRAYTPVTVMSISSKTMHEIYRQDIKAFSIIVMNLARDLSRRLRYVEDVVYSRGWRIRSNKTTRW